MKQIMITVMLAFSFLLRSQTNDSVKVVFEKILNHAESSSLYRKNVSWDSLKSKTYILTKEAKTIPDLRPALMYLLEAIGDEHGRIFHNNQMIAYNYGSLKGHHQNFNSDIYNKIQSGHGYSFEAKILEGNIGYVRIVGLPMGDNLQMSKIIEDEICKIASKKINNWIIDLRYNGGGNIFPMAEGLALLIGNGYVGGSEGLTEAECSHWKIINGDFYYDNYSVQLKANCKIKKKAKIAVLTSVYTASSGEAIAVILKGRKNTRFFGSKTLGMVTVTDWNVIDPLTTMMISVSYYKDRKGKVYKNYVDVDVEVPFSNDPLSSSDEGVLHAIKWLLE